MSVENYNPLKSSSDEDPLEKIKRLFPRVPEKTATTLLSQMSIEEAIRYLSEQHWTNLTLNGDLFSHSYSEWE